MLSILKKKQFKKSFKEKNQLVFSFPNFHEKKNYCFVKKSIAAYCCQSNHFGNSILGVSLIKQQASTVHSLARESTLSLINSGRVFRSRKLHMCHSNVKPFCKKINFKKQTNQKLFSSPSSIEGQFQQLKATTLYKATDFSLYKIKNYGFFFNEIMVADQLSRKTRKTNMQIAVHKKVTCSYTGKQLVLSPTNLSLPLCALTFLTGQKSTLIWATKSVSSWKLRKNSVIGCKVTLRRQFAFLFLDKLYLYGRQGLLEKKKNFLNDLDFCFGVSKNNDFIELQKSDHFSFGFSGFSLSIK